MAVKFTNNAATTLAAGINSSVTSIAVTDGSVFPTITGSDHFYVTFDDTTNKEIVKVTARSGNTLTVVRGHDNTTARAFSSGDKAELRIVAALLDDVKTEVSSTLTVDTFTGDDSTTAFTLSVAPASEDNLIVFIEGVYQNPGDFTLSGTTLTLDVAPLAGRKIIVYHVAALVSGNNLTHNQFTCNGSTTAFTLGLSPIHENNTQVFLDGVYQQKTDYAVSGTTLTMDTAPANGAILEVMTFTQTEVNTLPASFVSGLTQVTAVGADHFMIFDATDSALKKSLVSDVLESATSISTSADATAITIDSNEKVTFTSDVTTGGHLSVGGNNNELRFYEGSNYVGFEAPALSADKIWVLPAADGSDGQVLTTNGSGTLSFADAASAFTDLTDVTVATSDPALNTNPSTGVGTLWLNKSTGNLWCCTDATSNANYWTNIGKGDSDVGFSATGGNSTVTSGGYKYHVFTASGNLVVTGSKAAQALIIAGGGGGGGTGSNGGGGGGAGGVVLGSAITLTAQTYSITVGAGGATGTTGSDGGNSSFPGETVAVGGGGGGTNPSAGRSGGSGGGGGRDSGTSSGGAGTSGQGNAGGGAGGTSCASGGGGGGAGQVGQQGGTDCGSFTAGMSDGGDGTSTYSAWGAATSTGVNESGTYYYAGGGGGAYESYAAAGQAVGGLGGGGRGASGYTNPHAGTNGTANTGSGGGAGQHRAGITNDGGTGGTGIVIVRYAV
jgi:hypothetical protein